jgi:hypothetical protein
LAATTGIFEVVVPELHPDGNPDVDKLTHCWHDNSDVNLPWQQGRTITQSLMYVFFTTDPVIDGDNASMGRSVLGRSGDSGLNFGAPLRIISGQVYQFVNAARFERGNSRPARFGWYGDSHVGERWLSTQ